MAVSLSGLKMPWLDKEKRGETGRYRYDAEKGWIPIGEWVERKVEASAYIMPDLDAIYGHGNFVSVIDGTNITSRSQLREHNKRHGVIQTGDVRGDEIRERTKRHMKYNPAARNDGSFSWTEPRKLPSGNLTEI